MACYLKEINEEIIGNTFEDNTIEGRRKKT
jgi:hypothetical protein